MRKIFSGKRKFLIIGLVTVMALVFGLRKYGLSRNQAEETFSLQRGDVSEELILSGAVKAENYGELYFQTGGQLAWVGVEEGDKVYKAQALARLDTVKLSADLQRARADLRSTEASLQVVYDEIKGHAADETFEQKESRTTAEVAKDKAYDAVTKAQKDLENATLFAPFTGTITYLAHSSPGINISPSEKQIEILDSSTLYLEATADQTEIINISEGSKVKIILDPFENQEFEGEVIYVGQSPISGESGSVYKVKIKFISKVDLTNVRVGMTGDARIILSTSENVLYVPSNFINNDLRGTYIHIGSLKDKTYIEIGKEGEENTEITSGANEGDLVYD
jgi:HlyD family secretion protein